MPARVLTKEASHLKFHLSSHSRRYWHM